VQSAWWSAPVQTSEGHRDMRAQEDFSHDDARVAVDAHDRFPRPEPRSAEVPVHMGHPTQSVTALPTEQASEYFVTGDVFPSAEPRSRHSPSTSRRRAGRRRTPSPPMPMWANVHARPLSEARGGSRNSPILRLSSPAVSTGSQGHWTSSPATIPTPAFLPNLQGGRRTPPASPLQPMPQAGVSPPANKQPAAKVRRSPSPGSRRRSRSPSVMSWPGPLNDGYYASSMFDLLDSVESAISAQQQDIPRPGWGQDDAPAAAPFPSPSQGGTFSRPPHPQQQHRQQHSQRQKPQRQGQSQSQHQNGQQRPRPPPEERPWAASSLGSQDLMMQQQSKLPPPRYREPPGKSMFGSFRDASPASAGRRHKCEAKHRTPQSGRPVRREPDMHRLSGHGDPAPAQRESLQEVDDILSLMPWWMS